MNFSIRAKGPIYVIAAATFLFFGIFIDQADAGAKYIFLFIGDGMGAAHRNAAELYLAGARTAKGDSTHRESQLVMNSFPVSGMIRTNSLSGITDSAAAGTALATGHKTLNSALAMNPATGERYSSIAAAAKARGMKVGIITSAFIQDATPAAFYGCVPKRTMHYQLGLQMIESGFDYFAGGGFKNPTGKEKKDKNLYNLAAEAGYKVTNTEEAFKSLTPGNRAIAANPKLSGGNMPWSIDSDPKHIPLSEFLKKGIELLDGEQGFFIMLEGALIDIASHANDAATMIHELIAFDEAVETALEFYRTRPEETLIVVTSDHETGDLALSANVKDAESFYRALSQQQGSYSVFERKISPKKGISHDYHIKMAREYFGPELKKTEAVLSGWKMSMTPKKERPSNNQYKKLYGPYDPFTTACIREMNSQCGIKWGTFYHTGRTVPVSAIGAGAEAFSGEYENTGIFDRLKNAIN